ncbi:MAG TPA: globin [Acidimicrobiales bacterium]|jgi:hemoglobin|nr:globin [Acidimicrobiales bacterium]
MTEQPVRLSRASGAGGAAEPRPEPEREARQATLYDLVGGTAFFFRLVDRFYEGVESDPPLRAIYPDDLAPGKEHLALFLQQYWGGPGTYSAERGHPRLRMRHVEFRIDQRQRDAWLAHMLEAVDAVVADAALEPEVDQAAREAFAQYFDHAATFLINAPG